MFKIQNKNSETKKKSFKTIFLPSIDWFHDRSNIWTFNKKNVLESRIVVKSRKHIKRRNSI